MNTRNLRLALVLVITISMLLACGGGGGGSSTSSTDDSSGGNGGGDTGPTVHITITVDDATPFVNNTVNFSASGANRAPSMFGSRADDITTDVRWRSLDESVLTINQNGVATTVSNGRVTVTASMDGETAEKTIDVLVEATVEPLWPLRGDWSYYADGSGDDIACIATNAGCLHGGERRKVVVTGQTSCAGLTITEALGAFDWTCDASSGTATFISTLKDEKNLSDLIDFDAVAFKQNSVEVKKSVNPVLRSRPAVWWTSPIEANPAGGSLTGQSSKIFLITNNPAVAYDINSNGVSFVIKPGVTLTGSATTNEKVISVSSNSEIWIEGDIDCAGDANCILLNSARYVMVRNVNAAHSAAQGIYLWGDYNTFRRVNLSGNTTDGFSLNQAMYNDFFDVSSSVNGDSGIYMNLSSDNKFLGVTVSNNGNASTDSGIEMYDSNDNVFSGVTASNNAVYGIYVNSGTFSAVDNKFTAVTASNNGSHGVFLQSAGRYSVFSDLTAVNNGGNGVRLYAVSNSTFMDVVSANSGQEGIYIFGGQNNTFSNFMSSDNSSYGIWLSNTGYNKFTGLLKVGGNANVGCYVNVPVSGQGLVKNTCTTTGLDDSTSYGIGNTSDAAFKTTGVTSVNSFSGKITTTDMENASNLNGTSEYGSVTDWVNFENSFRAWGLDGSSFPNSNNQGFCSSGTCRIWDWSLKSADVVLNDAITTIPTGNDILTHDWSDLTNTVFLKNAVEVMGDDIGNDNTLCETGETCVYMPNIGSYQGHGSLISAGSFTGGTLTGITLKKYETNGR